MIHKYRAWDEKWERWILPEDISYYAGEWFFERRGWYVGGVIETAQLKDGIILEQYTDLCDKNGKEGYFGDKIQTYFDDDETKGDVGVLVWNKDMACISIKTSRGIFPLYFYSSFEVIGNVHMKRSKNE